MRPKRDLQVFECTCVIEPSRQRLSSSNFKRVFCGTGGLVRLKVICKKLDVLARLNHFSRGYAKVISKEYFGSLAVITRCRRWGRCEDGGWVQHVELWGWPHIF